MVTDEVGGPVLKTTEMGEGKDWHLQATYKMEIE